MRSPAPLLVLVLLGATACSAVPTASRSMAAIPAPGVHEAAPPATSLAPTVAVSGATADQRHEVAAAVDRFVTAGLPLPDLAVAFHDDDEHCHGHLGLFRAGEATWTVDVCSDLPFVLTHELAHAWLEAHVDESTRAELLAATGLPAWRGDGHGWDELGVERAAFVVQQVLMAAGGRLTDEWAARHAEFELLTGGPVPDADRWAAAA